MIWLVNLASVLLTGFIVWWFWLARPLAHRAAGNLVPVKVADGVYEPARIELDRGREYILRFERLDPAACAEIVRFDELGIKVELPLNKSMDVAICIDEPGEYEFSCDMRMYLGKLVVS